MTFSFFIIYRKINHYARFDCIDCSDELEHKCDKIVKKAEKNRN